MFQNANMAKIIIQEHGSLYQYFQSMLMGTDTGDLSITNAVVSEVAVKISKDLKKRKFNFVGPTTLQSFLQATGLFTCHDTGCFRYRTN